MIAHVRVPASSANLGPGFDSLGLALALYNEVTAEEADGVRVAVEGEGVGRLAANERNVVARGVSAAYDAAGRRFPGCALTCVKRIPLSRRLGSSAAAWAGGRVAGAGRLGSPAAGRARAARGRRGGAAGRASDAALGCARDGARRSPSPALSRAALSVAPVGGRCGAQGRCARLRAERGGARPARRGRGHRGRGVRGGASDGGGSRPGWHGRGRERAGRRPAGGGQREARRSTVSVAPVAPRPGVLPYQSLRAAADAGWITATAPIDDKQFQPASLDLRLGPVAYQLRASFLPYRETV